MKNGDIIDAREFAVQNAVHREVKNLLLGHPARTMH
jgi:hypothetical protein